MEPDMAASLFVPEDSSHLEKTNDRLGPSLELSSIDDRQLVLYQQAQVVARFNELHEESAQSTDDDIPQESQPSRKRRKVVPQRQRTAKNTRRRQKTVLDPVAAMQTSTRPNWFSNAVVDAANNKNTRTGPVFAESTRRKDAVTAIRQGVKEITDDEDKIKYQMDMTAINLACSTFKRGITPAIGGRWSLKGLKTPLLSHQLLGAAFMLRREQGEKPPYGGILADEVGFGKTIQCLSCIIGNQRKITRKGMKFIGKSPSQIHDMLEESRATTLVVLPSSLVQTWRDELEKHCDPDELARWGPYMIYRAKDFYANDPFAELNTYRVILTTHHEVVSSHEGLPVPLNEQEYARWLAEHGDLTRALLHRNAWHRVLIDEAHQLRNPDTKLARACWALDATHKWAITATPFMNKKIDIWSQLRLINMPDLPPFETFSAKFISCSPEHSESSAEQEQQLQKLWMRRTHQDTLLGAKIITLPNAQEEMRKVSLRGVEREVYLRVQRALRREARKSRNKGMVALLRLRQLAAHTMNTDITWLLSQQELDDLKGWLSDLDPSQTDQNDMSMAAKLKQLILASEDLNEPKRKVIAADPEQFSFFTGGRKGLMNNSPASKLNHLLNSIWMRGEMHWLESIAKCVMCRDRIAKPPMVSSCLCICCEGCLKEAQETAAEDGYDKTPCPGCGQELTCTESCSKVLTEFKNKVGEQGFAMKKSKSVSELEADFLDEQGRVIMSAKAKAIRAQITQWLEKKPDAKIIIYSLWIPIIRVLSLICKEAKWSHALFYGDISQGTRNRMVHRFAQPNGPQILIASLRCGGTGLNLTCASRVIITDPWWNDATERQAMGRVFRYGQKQKTRMLRIVVKSSVEIRLEKLKKMKTRAIDEVMVESDIKKLSHSELLNLFGEVRILENGETRAESDEDEDDNDNADANSDPSDDSDGDGDDDYQPPIARSHFRVQELPLAHHVGNTNDHSGHIDEGFSGGDDN